MQKEMINPIRNIAIYIEGRTIIAVGNVQDCLALTRRKICNKGHGKYTSV